ncbi:hypothetical protein D3C72_2186280 [compost metagenome]
MVTTRPSGDTKEAEQPSVDTMALIGCLDRSASFSAGMAMPMRFSSALSCGSWCGCHWPSSAWAGLKAASKAAGSAEKASDLNKMVP